MYCSTTTAVTGVDKPFTYLQQVVVSEHVQHGAFVAHVNVIDHDLADNSRVVCDVTSRDSAFQLVPHHDHEYLASRLITCLVIICCKRK